MNCLLRSAFLFVVLFATASGLLAQDGFDSLVKKLADDRYVVRMEAKEELLAMCREKPALLDRLAPIAFDGEDEVERVAIVHDMIADLVYVERGAIGIMLDHELIVRRMVDGGPAMKSGIQIGSQLTSIAGKPAKGKTPTEIYSVVHATRPGTKLEMEFFDKDGETMLYHPVVVPRGTIRDDENTEERKKQAYEEWMEKQGKRFHPDAD